MRRLWLRMSRDPQLKLDQHLDQNLIDINTTVNTWLTVSWELANFCGHAIECWSIHNELVDTLPTINQLSIECQSSVDGLLIEMSIEMSIEGWLRADQMYQMSLKCRCLQYTWLYRLVLWVIQEVCVPSGHMFDHVMLFWKLHSSRKYLYLPHGRDFL